MLMEYFRADEDDGDERDEQEGEEGKNQEEATNLMSNVMSLANNTNANVNTSTNPNPNTNSTNVDSRDFKSMSRV
jgi:hypothetical protein